MTASNIFPRNKAVYLLTDYATYDADGVVVAFGPKTLMSDRLKLAAACSGTNYEFADGDNIRRPLFDQLRRLIMEASAAADFLAGLPAALRLAHEELVAHLRNIDEDMLPCARIFVGVWDDMASKGEAYAIQTPNSSPMGGMEAFKVGRLTVGAAGPPVDRSFWPAEELTPSGARKLIEEQRRTPADDGTYRVGGAAQLITVGPDGITSQIVKRWPQDRLGEKIRPQLNGPGRSWRWMGFLRAA